MAYNIKLANRVRIALAALPDVEEKMMFRGVTFMVNGKMCISVGGDELMCRVGPVVFAEVIENPGCRAMIRNGKQINDFVFVDSATIKTNQEFDNWVKRCLDFNPLAKATKKKK